LERTSVKIVSRSLEAAPASFEEISRCTSSYRRASETKEKVEEFDDRRRILVTMRTTEERGSERGSTIGAEEEREEQQTEPEAERGTDVRHVSPDPRSENL
jgi:hypothetical protein